MPGQRVHDGLPGHRFVLIDARSTERWYGEYPSRHCPAAGLTQRARAQLRWWG